MNIEQLNKLARTDFSKFIQSENNVKFKLVMPFLQSFNHKELDLEHAAQGSRIDINIGNRIIIETKALNINLDGHVQQLSNYSGKELPVLSILTNGRQFRIYSPQWKKQTNFSDKIIYNFELTDLHDIQLLNRLEKILDFSNYESDEFIDNIEQREKEIITIKKEIDDIEKVKAVRQSELTDEINNLKEQVSKLNKEIQDKEKSLIEINKVQHPEIFSKINDYYLPIKKTNARLNTFFTQKQNTTSTPNKNENINLDSLTRIPLAEKKNSSPSASDWIREIPDLKHM